MTMGDRKLISVTGMPFHWLCERESWLLEGHFIISMNVGEIIPVTGRLFRWLNTCMTICDRRRLLGCHVIVYTLNTRLSIGYMTVGEMIPASGMSFRWIHGFMCDNPGYWDIFHWIHDRWWVNPGYWDAMSKIHDCGRAAFPLNKWLYAIEFELLGFHVIKYMIVCERILVTGMSFHWIHDCRRDNSGYWYAMSLNTWL